MAKKRRIGDYGVLVVLQLENLGLWVVIYV